MIPRERCSSFSLKHSPNSANPQALSINPATPCSPSTTTTPPHSNLSTALQTSYNDIFPPLQTSNKPKRPSSPALEEDGMLHNMEDEDGRLEEGELGSQNVDVYLSDEEVDRSTLVEDVIREGKMQDNYYEALKDNNGKLIEGNETIQGFIALKRKEKEEIRGVDKSMKQALQEEKKKVSFPANFGSPASSPAMNGAMAAMEAPKLIGEDDNLVNSLGYSPYMSHAGIAQCGEASSSLDKAKKLYSSFRTKPSTPFSSPHAQNQEANQPNPILTNTITPIPKAQNAQTQPHANHSNRSSTNSSDVPLRVGLANLETNQPIPTLTNP